jgi:rubredoxin
MTPPPDCPMCEGQAKGLGMLGWLLWYQCRECGFTFFSRNEPEKNPSDMPEVVETQNVS